MSLMSAPTIQRLCTLFQILKELKDAGYTNVSSNELSGLSNTRANTIRKDISNLNTEGIGSAGYNIEKLMNLIGNTFGFFTRKRACVVGLGSFGLALIQRPSLSSEEIEIVAGFDSSINRIETLSSSVPLFSSDQLHEVVNRLKIEYALCAVPVGSSQELVNKLVKCGIKGILNFAPTIVRSEKSDVQIKNMNILGELRIFSATLANHSTSTTQ